MAQRNDRDDGFTIFLDFADVLHLDQSQPDVSIAQLSKTPPQRGRGDDAGLPNWVGFFGYEFLARHLGVLCQAPKDIDIPDGLFASPRTRIEWTPYSLEIQSQLPGRAEALSFAMQTRERAFLKRPDEGDRPALRCNFDFKAYQQVFEAVQHEIRAGNTYQIKISQRFETDYRPDPAQTFAQLTESNPASEAFLLAWDDWALVSCSPETVVDQKGLRILTKPIGGTFPRDRTKEEDAGAFAYLRSDPKENAEHNMLVDLERNDLNRICESGTVQIDELRKIETYAHVHHLVTQISGRLREGIGLSEILRSLLPGGSITGCPKHRTIELIDKFEPSFRGPYTGAFGTIYGDERVRLNLIIRTLLLTQCKAYVQAGGGIVIGSNAAYEYRENQLKARALLDLLC